MNLGNVEGDYSFIEDEIRNSNFTVRIKPARKMAHILLIIFPILFFLLVGTPLAALRYVGMGAQVTLFETVIVLTFFMGLVFFFMNVGKKAVVSGRGIILRNWFFFTETINVNEVERCEVITGLTSHGRYHTEHFSKAILYYGGGYRFSVTDNLYAGWNDLVRYMELNRKTEYIDGRSKISRFLDDLSGKR